MKISNKLIAECFGTFVLVFGGCGAAIFAGHAIGFAGVALAFGLTVVAMAYGIGHISGAHLNPAVSLGVYMNGRMELKEMFQYWAAQVVGAVVAGLLLLIIWNSCHPEPDSVTGVFAANGYGENFQTAAGGLYLQVNALGAFIVEMVATFIFLMVILGVTDSRHGNGKFAGLAIGLTLTLIHLVTIPLTNTSVNPARSISQALFSDGIEEWSALGQLWLFILAPLAGAALAGLAYKCLTADKKEE